MWAVAWLLGAVTLLATVALLAVSGWFISAAAAAGVAALSTAYMLTISARRDYPRAGDCAHGGALRRAAGFAQCRVGLAARFACALFGRLAVAPGRADVRFPPAACTS